MDASLDCALPHLKRKPMKYHARNDSSFIFVCHRRTNYKTALKPYKQFLAPAKSDLDQMF